MKVLFVALAASLLVAKVAAAAEPSLVEKGRLQFEYSCAPCHGPGKGMGTRPYLPGTDALNVKYQGTQPPLLSERTNLTAEVIRVFVRNGIESMPSFRKTELSDEELDAIAAYLTRNNKN